MSRKQLVVSSLLAAVSLCLAPPLLAVWPMPQYGTYPCAPGTVSPPENCTNQGGNPNLLWQVKLSDRSVQFPATYSCTPVSGSFGGFCDGPGCTSQAGFCRQPAILGTPSYEIVTDKDGLKVHFHVEYDFPGNYCQLSPDGNVAEWPIVFNNYHLDRVQILDATGSNLLVDTMAVFEHGQWNPFLPLCGNGTYQIRVLNECAGAEQTVTVNVALPSTVSLTACQADRNCPWCNLTHGGGPSMPNDPGEPIHPGSGDVTVPLPLFTIAQDPVPLSFALEYHSELAGNQQLINEPMGRGWTHNFNPSLRAVGTFDNDLHMLRSDGSEAWYRQTSATTWISQTPGDLRESVSLVNGQLQVKDLDGRMTGFDAKSGAWLSTMDRWGNTISGTYNSAGQLIAIIDSEGRPVQLAYAGALLTQITLPDGQTWRFAYAGGELAQIFDPMHTGITPWRTFEYSADTRGTVRLLTAVRDEAGVLLEGHAYDALERGITSFREGNRDLVSIAYDGPNPTHAIVATTIDGSQSQTATFTLMYQRGRYLPTDVAGDCASCGGGDDHQSFSFDNSNYPTSRTDGDGDVTQYAYDANGNVTSRVDAARTPRSRTTTFAYGYAPWPRFVTQVTESSAARPGATSSRIATWSNNEQTLTATETGWLHATDSAPTSYTTTTTFDTHHRPISVDGPRTDVSDVMTRAYYSDTDANADRRGRLQSVTDPAGLTTSLDNYDVYGTSRLTTDPNGIQTVTQTDARGRVVAFTNKAVPSDPREPSDYTSTHTYDGRDRLTRSSRPRGNTTTFAYEDGSNRLTDTIRLDANGNEVERRHVTLNVVGDRVREEDQSCTTLAAPCATWVTKRQEDFVYDLHNRLVQVVHTVPAGASVAYTYDSAGLLQSVKDENHATANTSYAYDELQRLTAVTQTLGSGSIVTRYGYDVQDNLAGVTDPNGNTTTYAYDDFRRMQSQTSPVTGTTTYTYDPAGNITSSTDANAATTSRSYDADNRAQTAASANGTSTETVTWTWDDPTAGNYGKGRLASMSDPAGSMTYAYERRGLLRLEQHTIQNNSYSMSYAYDANGNRTSMTYPSSRVVTYAFDFADRPLSATAGGAPIVSSATYAPFGPETQLTFGNGTTSAATFDSRYMPVDRRLTRSGTTIAGYAYAHDAAGNITSIHDVLDPTYNRDFAYDDLYRLTGANSGGALWGNGSYAYDAMGNMTSLSLGSSRQSSFAYAASLPKLTNVTENGSARAVAYDAAGNEQTVGASSFLYSPRNYLASGDGLTYTYDGRGLRTITTVTAALGTFSGAVVTAANGTPVADAIVTVDGTLNSTSTDASGNFSLNQPSGNFTLTVTKTGYLPQTTTAFTLAAGGSVPVGTVMLSVAPSTITGAVVSSLGGPVAGATIALGGTTATTSTNSSGQFSITQPAGTFTATVSAGGYQSQTIASFTTQPGLPYSHGTITLTAIPATVSGTVLSSTGGAVAGATVTASSIGSAGVRRASSTQATTTDSSGSFQFSLGAGTYTFTIAKSGFGTVTMSGITVGPGSAFSIGTIVIDPLGTITGQVVAQATGSPVVNATVSVSGTINTTSTDSTGHFSVQQPPGTYAIRVSATGFADATTPFFTLVPGATHDAGQIQLSAVALTVNVGYADDLRASANFPIPWAGAPNVIYIGTPSPLDAGAIRLDNSTDAPMPIDNVTVDLGRPGPAYNLWGSFVVPAHGSVILTQTAQFNFDTSDSPIVACGATIVPGDPRVPRVLVTSTGVTTTYFDTGHILDTGGYDSACRTNESLSWRPIGTTGVGSNGDFLLGPPTGTAALGTPYTVTASVTDANGNPQPNITVAFKIIQGPNIGVTRSAPTDASGHASFTYTGTIAGTDTIQATITNASGGTSTSNPVTVTWPAFTNVAVFVGYADDLRAGASFPNPWQGSPGVVFIGNRTNDWDSGTVRIDNTGDAPLTVDRVVVDLQRPGPTFSLWGSFTIPAHQSVILAQTNGENFDTSDSAIVGCGGTLSPTEKRIPKITITIAGQSASYLDTAHILDTFGYDLACRGNESLQWRPVGSSSTASAGNLALRPLTATTIVGGTYTATAIATDAGNEPVANVTVNFLVPSGPNSGKSGQATTNSSGIATFSYASTAAGSDTLRASITNSVGAVLTSNEVFSTWVATATLQLSPDSATTTAGNNYNATVLVTDGSGNPLPNLFVTFRVTSGPNAGKSGQGITDNTGHATFTYFSTVTGTDDLVASVIGSGGTAVLSNQVASIWVAPVTITLAPSSATTPIGSSYTATAFVASGGTPSAGSLVTFTVLTGPNAGRTQTSTTDGTGHTTFTYTSSATGTDVIGAAVGTLQSNEVVAKWAAIPTAIVYTGTLAGEFNDPMTLAARLTAATTGSPIAGQTIAFHFGGQPLSATTDGTGTASVTLTPSATPGAIPVTASFTATGSYLGSSVSLFVNIIRDESAIAYTGSSVVENGTAQTLSAVLTDPDGGAPLANRTITFTIGAVSATAITDATGLASTSVTIPASLGTGPIRLNVSFAGDATNVPASTSVPVILYAPESFVIWGGNAITPRVGDHVNFWGSQWNKQVTGGDYDPNAQFKGWATPADSPLVPCEATQHADGKCWTSKSGQSNPPDTIDRYISVIVSTSIALDGSTIEGNIAAAVVVRVDPVPVYGNDPGKPGYGTIVGVIADGATLFATSTRQPVASTFFFRHAGHARSTPVTQSVSRVRPDADAIEASTLFASILTPAPFTVAAGTKRYSLYTLEVNLMAETALQANGTPPIAYEYIWFNGHPVAQIDAATSTVHWTFTDHFGTPLLLTNADGTTYWRAEYEPYGAVFALRSSDVHQPLRLPGQEAEQLNLGGNGVTEREYNIFRWYRSGWGRYTQADPIGVKGGLNLYRYASANPVLRVDPLGLAVKVICRRVNVGSGFWAGLAGAWLQPVHCRLQVSCGCSDGQGDPRAPFNKTIGMEATGGGFNLNTDNFLAPRWGGRFQDYDRGWLNVSVTPPRSSNGCEFERCLLREAKTRENTSPQTYMRPYEIQGPNSNSYIRNLVDTCGGSAEWPRNAYGADPNPFWGGNYQP